MIFNRETAPFVSLLAYRARANQREGAAAMRTVAKSLAVADQLRNEQADDMLLAFPYWKAGEKYKAGEIVTDPENGQLYILCQNTEAAKHFPPHAEGLLALYRPIPKRLSDGTFIFIYGQNVFSGDVCRDADGIPWIAQKDMIPCVWPPASGNEWKKQSGLHADTKDDPIPYSGNMVLENGKYYTQDNITYLCTRDSDNPVYNALSELVGIYVIEI